MVACDLVGSDQTADFRHRCVVACAECASAGDATASPVRTVTLTTINLPNECELICRKLLRRGGLRWLAGPFNQKMGVASETITGLVRVGQ